MSIEVTFCVTSYNRKNKLKNCIESFLQTTTFPKDKLEIVLVDNGSDDLETVKYVKNLDIQDVASFQKIINEKNDYPYCLRRAKNQARTVAKGKYFIDCPDDHIFVVRSGWIQETIEYLNHEPEKISCVCHYAYPMYRFSNANNLMIPSSVNEDFFVSQLKGYADYHLMKKDTYDDIGKYDETLEFSPNSESEYMGRSYQKGYRRALRRYPVSVIVDDNFFGKSKYCSLNFALPEETIRSRGMNNRPMSCEELIQLCLETKALEILNE